LEVSYLSVAKAIKKISDSIDKIGCWLVVLFMAGMVLFTSVQIIARVFFQALPWSEEIVRYLLVWSTFIGAGCVYKRGGHISVTFVQDMFKGNSKKFLQSLVHILCAAFFAIAFYFGIKYMGKQGGQLSAALRIPMNLMYMAIPVGCGIMFLHAVNAVFDSFEKKEVEA
jgi:TRAP-type C4-dicarboxylate transport system permease small subunit